MRGLYIVFFILIASVILRAQEYEFRHFTDSEGLSNSFIYDISEDHKGYMWLASAAGLFKYDGYNFVNFTKANGLAESFVRTIHIEDTTIFLGHNNGCLSIGDLQGEFKSIVYDDTMRSAIINIFHYNKYLILVTENEGVHVFDPANEKIISNVEKSKQLGLHIFSAFLEGNQLLIGGESSLTSLNLDYLIKGTHKTTLLKEFNSPVLAIQPKNQEQIFLSIQDDGIVEFTRKNRIIETLLPTEKFGGVPAVHLSMDETKGLWISTYGDGVFKMLPPYNTSNTNLFQYTDKYGLDKYCQFTYHDSNNHHWVSGFGSGVSYLVNDYLTFYKPFHSKGPNNIYSLAIEEGEIAVVADTMLIISDLGWSDPKQYDLPASVLSEDISRLLFHKDRIYITTKSHGLYAFSKETGEITRLALGKSKMTNSVLDAAFYKGYLCLATYNGLVVYDAEKDEIIKEIDLQNGLDHNVVTALYADSVAKMLWFGTKYGSLFFLDNSLECKKQVLNNYRNDSYFSAITKNRAGHLMMATNGNGVIEVVNEDSVIIYDENNGLLSNYCYGLNVLKDNQVAAIHRNGITDIDVKNRICSAINSDYGIKSEVNKNASAVSKRGDLWLGTEGYLVRYNVSKYKPLKSLPKIDVYSLDIDDVQYNLKSDLNLPYGKHKIEYYYHIINLTDKDKFKVEYRMSGLDTNWYPVEMRNVLLFKNISFGKYHLNIRVVDSFGNEKIYSDFGRITINRPIWYRWWFYPILIIIIVLSIYLYISIQHKNHEKVKEYLYAEIDKRTHVIKSKNKNLTDSINYAKKIQDSLLPNELKFRSLFKDFFILYKPKDIVGGDFYFIREKPHYYVVGVGDCTGHGVPGGFMTMLSINLLNTYVLRDDENRPDKVLMHLDESISNLLHNNQNNDSVHDGLDIALCKIDYRNKVIYFSGARRPLYMIRKGELIVYKGSRKSLGETENKRFFELEIIDYEPGDLLYMFSDGYVDQFNQTGTEKLMMKRFQKKIKEVNHMPLEAQKKAFEDMINNWKGPYTPQTDDIILAGFLLK